MNALLERYCEEALTKRRKTSTTWQLKVENAIVPLLPHGLADIGKIAAELGVSRRTLARRLAAEGLSFRKILDRLRFDLAKRYIREQDLPVSEIAWLLGYQEASTLIMRSNAGLGARRSAALLPVRNVRDPLLKF